MPTVPKFVLDANVFIEAKRRYYRFDICPGFWTALLYHQDADHLISIDRVKTELEHGNDELKKWVVNNAPSKCFASTNDPAVILEYRQLVAWVQGNPQFSSLAKADFASKADAWLIAYAKAKGCNLVTHEVFARDVKNRVPMPNVCRQFGVPTIDTFDMLKTLDITFQWQAPPTAG